MNISLGFSIGIDGSLSSFPETSKIKMQPTALAILTSPYLFSFINLGEKNGRAGKQDLNKGR